MSRKRVSFSQLDEIIMSPHVDSETSSEGLAEACGNVFEEDDSEVSLAHRADDVLSPSPPSSHDALVELPATPLLRTRELPPDDEVNPHSTDAGSISSLASTSSSSPRSTFSPGVQSRHIPDDQSISVSESEPSFILSPRLISSHVYHWDVNLNPLSTDNPISSVITDDGHLPAAFSVNSRASYMGQITVRHRALPWILVIQRGEGDAYVSIRDIFTSIHTFLKKEVSDAEMSRESSTRRRHIVQTAMIRSRSQIRRVDWLLDECIFAGLSLGKDGKTVTLLTSSVGPRG